MEGNRIRTGPLRGRGWGVEEKGETRSRTEIEDRKRHQSAGRKRKDRNRGRGTDEWRLGGGGR